MKSATIICAVLMLLISLPIYSQHIMLESYGVSPAQVKADTLGNENFLGIFSHRFSGLLNVGVETRMYLKGSNADTVLTAPTWSILSAPNGSVAGIDTVVNIDESSQIAVFSPDIEGTYVVEFADGGEAASVTINVATYLGIEAGNCAMCHSGQVSEWDMTGHAHMLTNALDGIGRSGASCLECHTTGHDTLAHNNGFDDFPFEYPENVGPGVADSLAGVYPEAMALANIQCETCHGPASAHFGSTADSKMVSSLDPGACAQCHDDDHYHVYPSQWEASNHANMQHAQKRNSCAPCHNGIGFLRYLDSGKTGLDEDVEMNYPITCAVCHDPHDANNEYQLRTLDATLENGEEVTEGGTGILCMNCHKSRRNAQEYTGPDFSYSSHYGPHYSTQADMLIGTNVPTFGKKLPTSPHLAATENACVNCHMYEHGSHGEHNEEGILNTSGMHSFSMVNKQGEDNVLACSECHGDIGETFAEKKFYMNGNADLDNDGIEEGLQEEIHGMLEHLAMMLPPVDTATVDISGTYIYTQTEAKAAYNYFFVEEDRSGGIHNPAFAASLLMVSMQAVKNHAIDGEIVAIDDVPNDQGKKVRIIWDKFVDDGVAIDPVQQYVVKRLDTDKPVWVGVGQHPADGSMRYALTVATVYDSTEADPALTTFKVVAITQSGNTHESLPANGYSIDNLIPTAPTNLMANKVGLSDVKLTWDDPVDEDFNYFAVYRSTAPGVEVKPENLVATLTGTEFTDAQLEMEHTYYYRIFAYDFSGNKSEPSEEVSMLLSGVEGKNNAVPKEFTLGQNYPNPFNPSTTIEFGVPKAEYVKINIFDIRGVHVRSLAQGTFAAGYHTIHWDGRNDTGNKVSAGAYMYRLESESSSITKKMVFLK